MNHLEESSQFSDKLIDAILDVYAKTMTANDQESISSDIFISSMGVAIAYVMASVSKMIEEPQGRVEFIEDVKDSFREIFTKALDTAVANVK